MKIKLILITTLICMSLSVLHASGNSESGSEVNPPTDEPPVRTVEDADGHLVPVPEKTDRIVCINSGLSVLLSALDKGDNLVGRDSNSTFPGSIRGVYVVAENSSRPNIELILEKQPDLILADNMMPDAAYDQFTSLGIPVAIFKTSDPRHFEKTILGVGTLTGKYLEARNLLDDLNDRIAAVEAVVSKAGSEGHNPPKVFFENRKPYSSASSKSGNHIPLVTAGGINIAADEMASSPKLSVEYVLKENPEVIIRRMSGDGTEEVMRNMVESISSRSGLEDVQAVRDNRVYALKSDLTLLMRYPVGVAYMAQWFYPEYAEEIDAEGLHKDLIIRYFGKNEWDSIREVFVYP